MSKNNLNPTAEVRAEAGKIVVTVGDGYYEIYVDKAFQGPALNNGQSHEYLAAPGEHRIGVYSAGRFVIDEMITVPAEEPERPADHENPASEPGQEKTVTITLTKDKVTALISNMEAIVAALRSWLED